jgi:regulator of RNase E activity RraA
MSESPVIRRDVARVPESMVERVRQFPAAVLADVAGRRGTMHGRIQPATKQSRFVGSALTVEVRPGDNLMIHAAIAIARPGDVIVVDGKGDQTAALMGAIMTTACKQVGVAAIVIDGCHRDSEELDAIGLPVFSAGANPNGPTKGLAGRVNWPITCGGVAIAPGDLIVGDSDGVVVIEAAGVEALLEPAARKLDEERRRIHQITHGGPITPSWLADSLRSLGALGKDESL